MNRHPDSARADWLRPTRPIVRRAPERETFAPQVTHPSYADLNWATALSMILGGIVGLVFVLAIAA